MIKVFNFENQDVRRNMVRALPGPRQMVLNTNENLAAIKAIVLDKDEARVRRPVRPGRGGDLQGQGIQHCDV